jgi:hypothetical protein
MVPGRRPIPAPARRQNWLGNRTTPSFIEATTQKDSARAQGRPGKGGRSAPNQSTTAASPLWLRNPGCHAPLAEDHHLSPPPRSRQNRHTVRRHLLSHNHARHPVRSALAPHAEQAPRTSAGAAFEPMRRGSPTKRPHRSAPVRGAQKSSAHRHPKMSRALRPRWGSRERRSAQCC